MVRTAPMVAIDRDASTVEIAGRWFPAVALICPPTTDGADLSELEHSLASGGADQSVYIPAENGLLLRVEEAENDHYHGLSLDLNARTCELVRHNDEVFWIPWSVGVSGGRLVPDTSNFWSWAEPEWVVETIDRLSRKSFTQPEGPSVKIVRLSYFDSEAAAS